MRPGQITTTELEAAILERIAKEHTALFSCLGHLHVLSREFTGAGSYTNFAVGQVMPDLPDGYLSLDALISVPGVPSGLGAVLACEAGFPKFLEIYTYGDELWDGDSSRFSLGGAA
jgi:hypothetical protein